MKAIAKSTLRVRLAPSTILGVTVGVVPEGASVEVVAKENNWAKVLLTAGGEGIAELGKTTPRYGYMSMDWLDFGTPPPPVTSGAFNRLGVNVINYGRGAEQAINAGCKIVLVMDDEDLAAGIKRAHPDVFVVFRRYVGSDKLNGDQLANKIGGQYPYIDAYQLFNEADSWGYGSAAEMHTRINHELRAADLLMAKGCGVMAGSYSMGCFDVTQQWALDAAKRYAPYYNDKTKRFWFDMHSYSPAMGRFYQPGFALRHLNGQGKIVRGNVGRNLQAVASWAQEPTLPSEGAFTYRDFTGTTSPLQNKPMDRWFEGRWGWLFAKDGCGFDPKQRKILMSETGVDEGGVGGFPAHNANLTEFGEWVTNWLKYQGQDIIVNGISYASPVLGATIYQYGEHTNHSWDGYDITGYISELKRIAW